MFSKKSMALKKKAKHKSPASKRRIVIIVLIICSMTLCQNTSQEKRKCYYSLKINTIGILENLEVIKNPSILEGFLSEWKGGWILDLWFRIWVKAIFQSLNSLKPHHNSLFRVPIQKMRVAIQKCWFTWLDLWLLIQFLWVGTLKNWMLSHRNGEAIQKLWVKTRFCCIRVRILWLMAWLRVCFIDTNDCWVMPWVLRGPSWKLALRFYFNHVQVKILFLLKTEWYLSKDSCYQSVWHISLFHPFQG